MFTANWQVKDARNELYHSANNSVTVQNYERYFDAMEKILEEIEKDPETGPHIAENTKAEHRRLKKVYNFKYVF